MKMDKRVAPNSARLTSEQEGRIEAILVLDTLDGQEARSAGLLSHTGKAVLTGTLMAEPQLIPLDEPSGCVRRMRKTVQWRNCSTSCAGVIPSSWSTRHGSSPTFSKASRHRAA
jgi:hypothetical protein